ncbi:hypothetical protein [Pseudoduganella namucuonensis]|uniref:Uncharacterized protein n=1 Tax=Pseudoduganella namucuonensis TaxID=1035707 RepID=A0A1I7ETY5_9BURK|nr:hypothetical protein [Pseudoduganella namucuonensis]SFU27404.1 hypothetical protein SAMN05216552_100172 [Pseudoduganella namucuonensis]
MITPITPLSGYAVRRLAAVDETGNEDSLLPRLAVGLSENASVVATLGGAKSTTQIYTAAGLLSAFQQAGTLPAPVELPAPGSVTREQAQQQLARQIAASLASDPSGSGAYTGTPVLQSLPTAPQAPSWGNVLKARPGLTSTAVANAYNAGIVSSFSVYA